MIDFHAQFVDLLDFLGDRVRDVYVDAGGLLANQRLAGDLKQDAAESRRGLIGLITHL